MTESATILLAHGSRDEQWRRPFDALMERLGALNSEMCCRLAYLEHCEPDLSSVVAGLYQEGVRSISILPLFFSAGRHLRDDVPRIVRHFLDQFPQLSVSLLEPIGGHSSFQALMVEHILSLMVDD